MSEPLEATEPSDFLILLLFCPGSTGKEGEPVEGVTRLQKLMFLLQQDVGPAELASDARAHGYGYDPYKMGPFSETLRDEVEQLRSAGIIRTERLVYLLNDDADSPGYSDPDGPGRRVESHKYRLTDFGIQIGRDLWASLDKAQQEDLVEFKRFFNSLSLRQLLIYTYERFPRYTTASEIKGELGLQ